MRIKRIFITECKIRVLYVKIRWLRKNLMFNSVPYEHVISSRGRGVTSFPLVVVNSNKSVLLAAMPVSNLVNYVATCNVSCSILQLYTAVMCDNVL